MVEDAFVLAPGVLEGVGQDWHLVPGAFVVDRPGQVANRAVVPREPERVDVRWLAAQSAGDVVKQVDVIRRVAIGWIPGVDIAG